MNDATKPSRTGGEPAAAFGFAFTLAVILAPFVANADGGAVRTKETQGAFVITIFSPSRISRDLPADVTVLVQRPDTGEIVMDAAVELSFVPPAGESLSANGVFCGPVNNTFLPAPGRPASIRVTRPQAGNQLLYGATVVLRAVGDWQLRATVRRGREEALVTCALPVGMPARGLRGLWTYLAFPPVVIALFGLNQRLRTRRGG
jgi:hypothetical protein